MKISKVFISVMMVVILFSVSYNNQQTVAPSCFEKEMCKKAVPVGYCEIQYDCIEGKCWYDNKRCPEVCYGGHDEDYDNYIDCKDSDCWNSPHCPCENAGYDECKINGCYCSKGVPTWTITTEDNFCLCKG